MYQQTEVVPSVPPGAVFNHPLPPTLQPSSIPPPPKGGNDSCNFLDIATNWFKGQFVLMTCSEEVTFITKFTLITRMNNSCLYREIALLDKLPKDTQKFILEYDLKRAVKNTEIYSNM